MLGAVLGVFAELQDNSGLGAAYRRVRLPKLRGIRMFLVPEFRNYLVFYTEVPEKTEVRILYVRLPWRTAHSQAYGRGRKGVNCHYSFQVERL